MGFPLLFGGSAPSEGPRDVDPEGFPLSPAPGELEGGPLGRRVGGANVPVGSGDAAGGPDDVLV
ncbi:hypothetical protein G3I23_42935, partial [Streptomyces sp. SID10115]|uniref:hypothetical protein n=1 Tax=Streptomyces sp. SID10115 TaxID=2706016 RepID=UPI0013C63909